MSSADQPDIVTDARPPAHLSAVSASPEQRDSRDWWPGADPNDAVPLPPAGQPGHGRTTSLRRQSAWIIDDRTGRHTGLFEIICRDCGDHLCLDYSDIPPRLQQIRGPYTLEAGLAAYAEHLGLVPGLHETTPGRSGAGEAMLSPADPDIAIRPRAATHRGAVLAPRSPHDPADSWPRTDGQSAGTVPAPGQPGPRPGSKTAASADPPRGRPGGRRLHRRIRGHLPQLRRSSRPGLLRGLAMASIPSRASHDQGGPGGV